VAALSSHRYQDFYHPFYPFPHQMGYHKKYFTQCMVCASVRSIGNNVQSS